MNNYTDYGLSEPSMCSETVLNHLQFDIDKPTLLLTGLTLLYKHKLAPEWTFVLSNTIRRFGSCSYSSKKIRVSAKLAEINSDQEVVNTILHEIAHALVGPRHGHNEVWRREAIALGCNGRRTHSARMPNWIASCMSCPRTWELQRLPKRVKYRCPDCTRAQGREVWLTIKKG